jgi:predicted N-acyltransferase
MAENDYVIRVLDSPMQIEASAWNALLKHQGPDGQLNPFMRHEYLAAMHTSDSATPASGWTSRFVTVYQANQLVAACPLYLKTHSYGEYVFDMAWANAYQQHGLAYYPKAVVAPPFTPVPGPRLLATNAAVRIFLVKALIDWCKAHQLSSLHLLFTSEQDIAACTQAGLMLRNTVQFHWSNRLPDAQVKDLGACGFGTFDEFLATLSQEKRKKIRQERRKVAEAGVQFRSSKGTDISQADWRFFYSCYERTYYEHGNAPYLSRDFFQKMADTMPENWLLFIAEKEGRPIASSLIALSAGEQGGKTAFGRYWGALERVDCLHFEACYYQPLQWCIAHGYDRFEGGAQGEHKMARALLPVKTSSAHWLAHPAFADAIERFLEREGQGIENYLVDLESRTPFRHAASTGNRQGAG